MQTMPEVWPDAVQGIINTFQQQNLPHLEVSIRTSKVALFSIVTTDNNKKSVNNDINFFFLLQQTQIYQILLELLTVLPEEVTF